MSAQSPPRLVADGPALAATGLVHRVRQPTTPGPHPAIVLLHGRSGDEDVMWLLDRALPPGCLVVAPRAILADPAGGYAWHPRRPHEWPSVPMFDQAVAAVTQFVRALPFEYAADPDRIFLMGFSQGAATALATALQHPGLVRGVVALVGFMPTGVDPLQALVALGGLPVFVAAGQRDDVIPLDVARAAAQVLREAGADLTYREYDTGHKLDRAAINELRQWWKQQNLP